MKYSQLNTGFRQMDNFWTSQSGAFSNIRQESRKVIVHPALADVVDQQPGVRLLDYGCGDGSFVQRLHKHCEIHLYDISKNFLRQASELLKEYYPTIHQDTSSIPGDYFDYVVSSLVLMTLPTIADIRRMLQEIHRALKSGGTALIAITHPSFRKEKFSTFQTEYTKGKPFDYFEEGEPFEVEITDPQTGAVIKFHDYHWTLSTVLNCMVENGLTIRSMQEFKDKSLTKGYINDTSSPYLLMVCRK